MTTSYNFGPFVMDNDRVSAVLVDDNKCVVLVRSGLTPKTCPFPFPFAYDWLCGYVAVLLSKVPESWIKDYYEIPVVVHGGVTYLRIYGEYVVIGFDCNHAGDENCPALHTPSHVMGMVKDLENQLKALGVI